MVNFNCYTLLFLLNSLLLFNFESLAHYELFLIKFFEKFAYFFNFRVLWI